MDIGGAKFDTNKGEYFFERDLTSNGKQAGTSKRSRSAADTEENKENFETREPKKQRRNSAWEPRHPTTSHDMKSDQVQTKSKRFSRNEAERQSRYVKFQNDDERETPKHSRSRSEHQSSVTVRIFIFKTLKVGYIFKISRILLSFKTAF